MFTFLPPRKLESTIRTMAPLLRATLPSSSISTSTRKGVSRSLIVTLVTLPCCVPSTNTGSPVRRPRAFLNCTCTVFFCAKLTAFSSMVAHSRSARPAKNTKPRTVSRFDLCMFHVRLLYPIQLLD